LLKITNYRNKNTVRGYFLSRVAHCTRLSCLAMAEGIREGIRK
jgi:hypothetical protein